jgi:hypothetical protein
MAQPERAILEMLGQPLDAQIVIARKYGVAESDIDAAVLANQLAFAEAQRSIQKTIVGFLPAIAPRAGEPQCGR